MLVRRGGATGLAGIDIRVSAPIGSKYVNGVYLFVMYRSRGSGESEIEICFGSGDGNIVARGSFTCVCIFARQHRTRVRFNKSSRGRRSRSEVLGVWIRDHRYEAWQYPREWAACSESDRVVGQGLAIHVGGNCHDYGHAVGRRRSFSRDGIVCGRRDVLHIEGFFGFYRDSSKQQSLFKVGA